MRVLLIIAFLVISNSAHACIPAPSEDKDKLIDWSSTVFIGRAANAGEIIAPPPPQNSEEALDRVLRPHLPIEYHFEVVKVLRGTVGPDFFVAGKRVTLESEKSDFNGHKDEQFWAHSGGRIARERCVKKPSFEIGKTYLIFDGLDLNIKSYELIVLNEDGSSEDKWLEYVEKRISSND